MAGARGELRWCQEGAVLGKTSGARGGLGLGLGTCPSRWPAAAYGVAGGRGAGRRRWKMLAVAVLKFSRSSKSSYVNSNFLLHLGLKWKSVEYHFYSVFEIYNFRVMHFLIRVMVWELFNYFKNCHLKYLSFHVNFGTFTPRLQLGFCLTWHGEYVYSFS